MPIKGILALRRNLPSGKTGIRFSRQSLDKSNIQRQISVSERHPNGWGKTEDHQMHHRTTKGLQSGMRSKRVCNTWSIQTSQRALQDKRTPQWCPQKKLLQKLRTYKGEEYRDWLGDTFQRKGAHSRQWRFVTQWHCGLRNANRGLHQGACRHAKLCFFLLRSCVARQNTWAETARLSYFLYSAGRRASSRWQWPSRSGDARKATLVLWLAPMAQRQGCVFCSRRACTHPNTVFLLLTRILQWFFVCSESVESSMGTTGGRFTV